MVAIATEFDPEETEGKSVNVDVALGVMKHSTTDGIVLDEFSLIVVPTNDQYLADLEDNKEIDLEKFEMMETYAFQKKILDLFKIQCIIKNMTKSGTHDNNAFNFVQAAMQEFYGFTPIAVYIIFIQDAKNIQILILFSN